MLATVAAGATTGPAVPTISPPIITSGPYQTVTAAPADGAAIVVLTGTTVTTYPQNMAFHKNAITLAVAQIDMPDEGAKSSRVNYDDISIRSVLQYVISSDKTFYRFDILYGIKTQNRGFGCRITG